MKKFFVLAVCGVCAYAIGAACGLWVSQKGEKKDAEDEEWVDLSEDEEQIFGDE